MINKINRQIEAINNALEWINANETQDYERQFLSFVEERRKLHRIAEAEQFNPAAAAYGESQKGKSYLMSNLLQKNGQPFMIHYGDKDYNFIQELNPKGDGTEATGVVTRFTSFRRGRELYSDKYPLLMRTLSVTDMILILVDGYYNDIRDYNVADGIKERAKELYDKYWKCPIIKDAPIVPDDLLEMEIYFTKYINNAQAYAKSSFFKRLALIADRIPVDDYSEVFGILWDYEPNFSELFKRLLNLQRRIGFRQYIYLPVEAVEHKLDDSNSIMSVQCLHGDNDKSRKEIDIYVRDADAYRTIGGVRKCDLAAICAEIIVMIPEDFLQSSDSYCLDEITDDAVKSQITKTPIKKDILAKIDLLDFPGARSRKSLDKAHLSDAKTLTTTLLRGKVAFLFNKYNESRAINLLLFCHDQQKSEVSALPKLIENWVTNYVGNDPTKRADTVRDCAGISPLFYIATKFNMDMAVDPIDSKNNTEALSSRWQQRFDKVVFNECFNGTVIEWVANWTRKGEKFTNSYLLRDFKYSGNPGSSLYTGFSQQGKEEAYIIERTYYDNLRNTFINSESAKLFFNNPELAWDLAASMRNDGALYIIERLGIVASHVLAARNKKFDELINNAKQVVLTSLLHYRPASGAAEQMQKNVNNAFAVIRGVEFSCDRDNYYFGHLLEGLQLKVKDIYDRIHDMIMSGEITKPANDFTMYVIIRKRCQDFEGCTSLDEMWTRLVQRYGFRDKIEAQEYLKKNNIDEKILFAEKIQPQLPSYLIANAILSLWEKRIKSIEFINTYASENEFPANAMKEFIDNIIDTIKRYDLAEHLHQDLVPYTDVAAVSKIPVSLVADIIASSISNFVTDFGYSLLDDDKKADLKTLAEREKWPVFESINTERKEQYEEDEIADIFDSVLMSKESLIPSFAHNLAAWLEYMFLSFVLRVERPKYTAEVCQQLEDIVDSIQKAE